MFPLLFLMQGCWPSYAAYDWIVWSKFGEGTFLNPDFEPTFCRVSTITLWSVIYGGMMWNAFQKSAPPSPTPQKKTNWGLVVDPWRFISWLQTDIFSTIDLSSQKSLDLSLASGTIVDLHYLQESQGAFGSICLNKNCHFLENGKWGWFGWRDTFWVRKVGKDRLEARCFLQIVMCFNIKIYKHKQYIYIFQKI